MPDGERIPILKIGDLLLVTIQVDMHDRTATQLQSDLTQRIVSDHARGVLIDISGLEIVDSFIGRMLAGVAAPPPGTGSGSRSRISVPAFRTSSRRFATATPPGRGWGSDWVVRAGWSTTFRSTPSRAGAPGSSLPAGDSGPPDGVIAL